MFGQPADFQVLPDIQRFVILSIPDIALRPQDA